MTTFSKPCSLPSFFLSLSTLSSPLLVLLYLFGLKEGQTSPFLKNKAYGALPLLENDVITHLSFSAKKRAVHALQWDHLSSLLPKGQSPSSSMSSPCTHPLFNTLSSVLSLHPSAETILCQCCPIIYNASHMCNFTFHKQMESI